MDAADISWLCQIMNIVSCLPGDFFHKNSSVRQIWTRGKTDICLDPLFTILLTSEIAEMWEVLQPSQDYLLWNISWDFDSQYAIFLVFVCICCRVCVRLFAEHLKMFKSLQAEDLIKCPCQMLLSGGTFRHWNVVDARADSSSPLFQDVSSTRRSSSYSKSFKTFQKNIQAANRKSTDFANLGIGRRWASKLNLYSSQLS